MTTTILLEILGIFGSLILSAFFSASETALTALPYVKLRHLIEKDEEMGKRLKLWLDKPNRTLTTILVGNNIVNIFASALATDLAYSLFKNGGMAIAVGGMTLLVLIFGEIGPKTIAKHNAEKFALKIMRPLTFFYYLFLPITLVLVKIINITTSAVGGDLKRAAPFMTTEDFEFLIELSHREGVLKEYEEEMLQSILEFRDTTIKEIMVPRTSMVAVDIEAESADVLQMLVKDGHSRLPAYKDSIDNIIGLLYAKDCLKQIALYPNEPLKLEAMLRKTFFVPETMKISLLLKDFQKKKTHMAIVVDEYGGTVGVVTLEDIIEEIVGEINDEYDIEERSFRKTAENKYLIDGQASIYDLDEALSLNMPESEQYETIGGYLTYLQGHIPKAGSKINLKNMEFIIKEADERHIKLVELSLLPESKGK